MTGTFEADIRKFVEKAGARIDTAVKATVVGIHARVDKRSPVGNPELWLYNKGTKENPEYTHYLTYNDPPAGYVGGRFRGNWQLGIGSAPEGELDTVDLDGSETRLKISAAIPEDAAGNVYWLVNNLPYAQRLEDGWSQQAPAGMVGLTMTEVPDIAREAVEQAKAAHP